VVFKEKCNTQNKGGKLMMSGLLNGRSTVSSSVSPKNETLALFVRGSILQCLPKNIHISLGGIFSSEKRLILKVNLLQQ